MKSLKEKTKNGEFRAHFEELLAPRLEFYRKWVVAHLGDDGEDVFQIALEKAWRNFRTLKSHDKFHSWFFRILNNTMIDHIRSKKRLQDALVGEKEGTNSEFIPPRNDCGNRGPAVPVNSDGDPSLDPESSLAEESLFENLAEALLRLDPTSRLLLFLFYSEGMRIEDMARFFGKKPDWVKVKLFRTRKKLARILEL